MNEQEKAIALKYCNDYGDTVDCNKVVDPRYTMSFADIGESDIYWCSVCGPKAREMDKAITAELEKHGIPFLEQFERVVNNAYKEIAKS